MKLEIITATMGAKGWQEHIEQWKRLATNPTTVVIVDNHEHNLGLLASYQQGYRQSTADVLAFIHDYVVIYEEGWDARVLAEFDNSNVGVVGFGGALVHGSPDLYRTPYNIQQLGRSFYLSNVTDAEVHGTRFDGACDVAALDGFALIVNRKLLDLTGGWPVDTYPPHHCYDYWITAMAHRFGYRVRVVGVRCHHLGGLTATTSRYQEWARQTPWGSDVAMHASGHKLIYNEFWDVLPWDARRTP